MLPFPLILFGLFLLLLFAYPAIVLVYEFWNVLFLLLITKKGVTVFLGASEDLRFSFKFTVGKLVVWFCYHPLKWRGVICVPKTDLSVNILYFYIIGKNIFFAIISIGFLFFSFYLDLHGFVKLFSIVSIPSIIFYLFYNLVSWGRTMPDGTNFCSDGCLIEMIPVIKQMQIKLDSALKLYKEKDYSNSAILFHELMNERSNMKEVFLYGYSAYMLSRNYQKAYDFFKDFENKFPLDSNDYYSFACNCFSLKRKNEFEFNLNKSLEIDPENTYSINSKGYLLNTEKRFNEAIPYFDKVILLNPDFAYAFNNRGHAKIEIGKLEEGLQDVNYSLNLDAGNSYVYRNLGIYYSKIGDHEKALNLFLKSKGLDDETDLIDELIEISSGKIS